MRAKTVHALAAPTINQAASVRAAVPSAAALLGSVLLLGAPAPASAQFAPPDPEANRAWGGCQLSAFAVEEIQSSIINSSGGAEGSPFSDLEVAFVVVYSLRENDGQALDGGEGGFTGPIICAGGVPFSEGGLEPFTIEATDETTDIPPFEDENVDILDLEEALVLRYAPNLVDESGPFQGPPEKRFCHSVDQNNDCFNVFFEPFIDSAQ